jgi:hypothetical protein
MLAPISVRFRSAREGRIRLDFILTKESDKLLPRDTTRPQYSHFRIKDCNDRRFQTYPALPAIEDEGSALS